MHDFTDRLSDEAFVKLAVQLAQYCYDNKTLCVKTQNSNQIVTVQKLFRALERHSINEFTFTAASVVCDE